MTIYNQFLFSVAKVNNLFHQYPIIINELADFITVNYYFNEINSANGLATYIKFNLNINKYFI